MCYLSNFYFPFPVAQRVSKESPEKTSAFTAITPVSAARKSKILISDPEESFAIAKRELQKLPEFKGK